MNPDIWLWAHLQYKQGLTVAHRSIILIFIAWCPQIGPSLGAAGTIIPKPAQTKGVANF